MAFLIVVLTLFSHAAPRCVDLFDGSVNKVIGQSQVGKAPTQEEYLKNYLALNMAFPQHRATISLGVTAFYFSRGMAFESIHKPLTAQQANLIYTAMIRAHAAVGVTTTVTFPDSQFTLASFTYTLPFRIEHTLSWLDTSFGSRDSAESMARIRNYSQTISATLRSAEARDLSYRFRASLKSNSESSVTVTLSRDQISDQMRDLVIQKLEETHPELSEVGPTPSRQTLADLLYEAMH